MTAPPTGTLLLFPISRLPSSALFGQPRLSHARRGEILLRRRGTPVHRNPSFESPPSSFTLGGEVCAHQQTHGGKHC